MIQANGPLATNWASTQMKLLVTLASYILHLYPPRKKQEIYLTSIEIGWIDQ